MWDLCETCAFLATITWNFLLVVLSSWQTGVLNRKMIYPLKVVLSDPKRTNWPSRRCTLDATGLGESDLPSQIKADITVRTDKHKQNIYGPSMTTVETVAKCHIWGKTVSTALGISKTAHKFLVLHYFATDSIIYWNSFIHEVMPLLPLPAPAVRRAEVVELLRRIHIAPSHRRMPHHTWKDALSLVIDLLSDLENVDISTWPECDKGQQGWT